MPVHEPHKIYINGRFLGQRVTGVQRYGREVLQALDARGIAIRGGDLASLPLLKRLGTTSAARASCYLYTTIEEIDRLAEVLGTP